MEAKAEQKPESSPGTRVRAAQNHVKQADSIIRTLADNEKDLVRREYLGRYHNNPAAVDADPEYKIRVRDIERECERRRVDIQTVLKLIDEHQQILEQLIRREEALRAREKTAADLETRVRTQVDEADRRIAEAIAGAKKRAAEITSAAEKAAEAKRADAEARLKQSEQEAKERIEAIAQTSREVDTLQAKLSEELKHIDDILNAAKSDLAGKLQQVLKEAQSNLDHARRDIDELLK